MYYSTLKYEGFKKALSRDLFTLCFLQQKASSGPIGDPPYCMIWIFWQFSHGHLSLGSAFWDLSKFSFICPLSLKGQSLKMALLLVFLSKVFLIDSQMSHLQGIQNQSNQTKKNCFMKKWREKNPVTLSLYVCIFLVFHNRCIEYILVSMKTNPMQTQML